MITSNQIYWLAGLLEGEGSFTNEDNCPRIQLKMTDRDIVNRARILLGSNVLEVRESDNPLHNTAYVTRILGNQATQWMFTLYSILGDRRKVRINSIIKCWKSRTRKDVGVDSCSKGHPLIKYGTDFRYSESKGTISKKCVRCQRIRRERVA